MAAKPWLARYDAGVPSTLQPYPDATLLDYLSEAAAAHPDAPVVHFKGRAISYAELERESDACAAAFASLGIRAGDRVALCLPNIPQFMIAEIGAWKIGAIVCPFSPMYTEREMLDALNTTGARLLVVLNRFYPKVKSIQRQTSLERVIAANVKDYLPKLLRVAFTLLKEKKEGDRITLTDGDLHLADLLAKHRGSPRPAFTVRPDDVATILMSGGTTGTPKGVIGTHRSMTTAGRQLQAWLGPVLKEWTDTIMLPLPLFHTYGNTGVQSVALINHNPIVLVPNPRDIKDLLKQINSTRPAFICAVPTLLTAIMNHPMTRAGKVKFDSIKLCFSGAAALMAETKRRFEEMTGGVIVEGYSLTEAQMAVVGNPVLGERKLGSVGMPLPDVDIRIVDADDGVTPLPPGEVGEILLSAPQLMMGYWERPDETREMLRADAEGRGVLYTGDLGYMDEDGYLFIVDRKKDLIKTSGFQVWPREVEEAIAAHAAVAECGVCGLPDEARGEIVKAWIVVRPDASVTAAELKVFCRERLAPYKVPSQWAFPTELPKTMVGKVLRRELRRMELETHATAS